MATRIAVAGIGAVGGIVAWHLARAGLAPTLVARARTVDALRRHGLTLLGGGADGSVEVEATAEARVAGPQDVVFACFKAHDWPGALEAVRPLLGPETVLVPIQNGIPWWFFHGLRGPHEGRIVSSVDPGGRLASTLPRDRTLGCVAYVAASRETKTRIRWNGRKRLIVGEPRGASTDRARIVTTLLSSAGLDAEATPDIRRELWAKLLGNVTYNPLSVITGATIGRLATHPPLRRITRLIMEETIAVGRALQIECEIDIDARLRVEPAMLDVKTSMLQDYEAGRPLELSAIVDAVLELARLVDVPTPTIESIAALAAERARPASILSRKT